MRTAANYTIRISSVILAAVMAVLCTVSGVRAAEDYGTWAYVTDWELNTSAGGANIADTLLDVPVLIRLDPNTFPEFVNTLSFGADIRFAKPDGAHLEYQIERWVDAPADQDTAEIWVRIDTLYGNRPGQIIKMHYGKAGAMDSSDAAAVFDSSHGFAGVWHLNEWMTGSGFDSIYADAVDGAWGDDFLSTSFQPYHVGLGQDFAGNAGECIRVRPVPSLNNLDTLVVSAWFWLNNYGGGSQGRIMEKNGSFALYADGIDTALVFEANRWTTTFGRWRTPLDGVQTGMWYHVVVVYDYSSTATDPQIFLNGVNQAVTELSAPSGTPNADSDTLYIGNRFGGDRPFSGWMDEVRIGHDLRPLGWFKTAYENQRPGQSLVMQAMPFMPLLTAMPEGDSTIALSWDIAGIDTVRFDTVGIWYRNDYLPDSVNQLGNMLLNVYGVADSADTVYGLDPDSMYYFGLFFKDTAGVWTDTAKAAFDSSMTAGAGMGGSPFIMAMAEGDSSVALWWSLMGVDTTMYDSLGIWYRQSDGVPDSVNEPGNLFLGYYTFSDTVDTVHALSPDSTYYFGLFLRDTLGYWTDYMDAAYDSSTVGSAAGSTVTWLTVFPLQDSVIALQWDVTQLGGYGYDSVGVFYRYDAWPDSAGDLLAYAAGMHWVYDTGDTLFGLEPDSLHYFALFARDTNGVWDSLPAGIDSAFAKVPQSFGIDSVVYYSAGTPQVADDSMCIWFSDNIEYDSLVYGAGNAGFMFGVVGLGAIGNAEIDTAFSWPGDTNFVYIKMNAGDSILSRMRSSLEVYPNAVYSRAGVPCMPGTVKVKTVNVYNKGMMTSHRTILQALYGAVDGDTIAVFDNGFYTDTLHIGIGGVPRSRLHITNGLFNRPQIRPDTSFMNLGTFGGKVLVHLDNNVSFSNILFSGISLSGTDTCDNIVVATDTVAFRGCDFVNGGMNNLVVDNGSAPATVDSCLFMGNGNVNGAGLLWKNRSWDGHVYGSIFKNNVGHGLTLDSAYAQTVQNSRLHHNGGNGIELRGCDWIKMMGNVVYDNNHGIYVNPSADTSKTIKIFFNTVVQNAGTGIGLYCGDNGNPDTVMYNIAWLNTGGDLDTGGTVFSPVVESNCYQSAVAWNNADSTFAGLYPQFADTAIDDFSLLPGSPCVDVIDTAAVYSLNGWSYYGMDLFGNPRPAPAGSFWDLGAIEETTGTGGTPDLYIAYFVDKNTARPGDTLTYDIFYDNDGTAPTGDTVTIQQLLPYYVSYDSGSVGGVYHTAETAGTVVRFSSRAAPASLTRDSLWAAAWPESVAGIKWTFAHAIGADNADDSLGIADDSGSVDAGYVRFRVIVK